MIDFHNHVLPNVDDGSTSLDMSLAMLSTAAEQGITDVVNTVHFQHPKVEGEDISHNRISEKINQLQYECDKREIPIQLHSGAEVFYLPNLPSFSSDPLATFGHGKYMLIEFQPHLIPDSHKQQLFELKMAGITPIIAHPERYKPVQENVSLVAEWLEAGCIIQVDAGSVLGTLGSKAEATSKMIINFGWCQIIGSDSHNDRRRNFCLSNAKEELEKMDIKNVDELVKLNPKNVIDGEPIHVEINYDRLEKTESFFSRIKDRIGLS